MDKTISQAEAAACVQGGMVLALGGMTLYRRPMAFVRALLQHNPGARNLQLLCFTASIESDLLIGAGRVSNIRSCYVGLEIFGLAPMFTQAANRGEIDVIEETEASLSFGIRAGLAGVGFMPGRGWLGTDLPTLRPDVRTVIDPYSGEELIAFPAIRCDVAVIHALQADRAGNALIGRNAGVDVELAMLASTTLVTTESLVEELDRADIPAMAVAGVTLAPQGAWPTSCHPHYPLAGDELLRYVEACNAEDFAGYLAALLATSAAEEESTAG